MRMKIVGPASNVAEFFDTMQYVSGDEVYDGAYVYHQDEGSEHYIAGLSSDGETLFFHTFGRVDPVEFEPVFLDSSTIGSISEMAWEIASLAPEPDENEGDEDDEDDETFGPAVVIEISEVEEGMLSIKISEHDPDNPYTPKKEVYQKDLTKHFPAKRVSEIILGERSKTPPTYVDRVDADENLVEVPDGPVTVWNPATRASLARAMMIARKEKAGFAIQKHHSSRMHSFRIGERIYGAITPESIVRSPEEMLSEAGVVADAMSLVMEPKFAGIPDDDPEFAEPLDEPEEESDEEEDGAEVEDSDDDAGEETEETPDEEDSGDWEEEPEDGDSDEWGDSDDDLDDSDEYEEEDPEDESEDDEEWGEGDFEGDPFGDEGDALAALLDE